ncbi:MAG: hypothetical protein HYX75_12855 [Acidobacteria bacterium]|nr:hypothetical protein [Acidobacteriota bacterium]
MQRVKCSGRSQIRRQGRICGVAVVAAVFAYKREALVEQDCGKVEAPTLARPFRAKPQMAQISARIAQILPAFNRRATCSSLSGRREAIGDICESICEICG